MSILSPNLTFNDSPVRHQGGPVGLPLALGFCGGMAAILLVRHRLKKEQGRLSRSGGRERPTATRLSEIRRLYKQNAISQEEYRLTRERILSEI